MGGTTTMGGDWTAGPAEGWDWEEREVLAQALAAETLDWLDYYCDDAVEWESVYRQAIAQGTATPHVPSERRRASADRAAEALRSAETYVVAHVAGGQEPARAAIDYVAARDSVAELLASAWLLGRWDWVVGERSAYLGGELIELDPESPHGAPGVRCSCGGARDGGDPCEHRLLAAILRGALRAPGRAIAPRHRPGPD